MANPKTLEERINLSREYYNKAFNNHNQLPKSQKVKTTAVDGINTVSGYSEKRISNRTRNKMGGGDNISPQLVFNQANDMDYKLSENSSIDHGTPGQTSASHAEKQIMAEKPGEPIGVSKNMCKCCKAYAQKQADKTGSEIIITNPEGTKIFRRGKDPIIIGWD